MRRGEPPDKYWGTVPANSCSKPASSAKVVFYIFLVLLVVSLLYGARIWKKAKLPA